MFGRVYSKLKFFVKKCTYYYALGLKIAAISSTKLPDANEGNINNKNLYNDKELIDEADLDWYDYGFRNYDSQIGRFPQLDPLTDDYPELTPFQYGSNDPIANVDLHGLEGTVIIGGVSHIAVGPGSGLLSGIGNAIGSAASSISSFGLSIGRNAARIGTELYNQGVESRNIRIQTGERIIEDVFREIKPTIGVGARVGGTILAALWPSDAIKGGDLSELQLYEQRQYQEEFQGNSNRKDNPNEHIVYDLYGEKYSGEKVLLKYGISDYTRYKEQRPRSQTGLDYINKVLPAAQKGLYGKITYDIRRGFNNRASALAEEIRLVSEHYWRNNRMPYLQKRPAPMAPPGEW